MGFGGISIWQLLIVLAIIILLFGTKKLRNIGGDLGSAVKSFKKAVKDGDEAEEELKADPPALDGDAQMREQAGQDEAVKNTDGERQQDKV